jgi:hypothetical protein
MRNISEIRRESIRRESKVPELNPKEIAKETKPLIQDVVLISQKIALNKGLTTAIAKKKKELMQVADLTKRVGNDVAVEADRVVVEAKKKATALISQAQTKKNSAQVILDRVKQKESELTELGVDLEILEKRLKVEKDDLEGEKSALHRRQDVLDDTELLVLSKKEETIDSWLVATAVLLAAVEQLEQAQKLESEVSIKVSQTLAKADTIIQRTAALVKIQDAREKQLDQKAIELQQRDKLLKDRHESLRRAASEIKKKSNV